MRAESSSSVRTLLLAAGAALLTACSGGGGGGSSSPPPPPPPPANAAPVVSFTLSAGTVDEGQPFTVDATGSSDADGDSLSFTLTQTGGPAAEEVSTGSGVFEFSMPEVTQDETLNFELSVSDGEDTITQVVSVTASNIVLTPEITLFDFPGQTFSGLNRPQIARFDSDALSATASGIIGFQNSDDETTLELFRFGYDQDNRIILKDPEFRPVPGTSAGGRALFTFGPFKSAFGGNPIYGFEQDDLLIEDGLRLPGQSLDDETIRTREVAAPCAMMQALPGLWADLIVGTRGDGLQVFLNRARDFDDSIESRGQFEESDRLIASGEICHVSGSLLDELFAYDPQLGAVRRWSTREPNPYEEGDAIPVDWPDGLELVDMVATGNVQDFFAIALVLSDGRHNGTHQLLVLSSDYLGQGEVVEQVFSWNKGVPDRVQFRSIDDPNDVSFEFGQIDIVVSLITAPYVVVVDDKARPSFGDVRPQFSDPVFAPIPLGVTDIRFGATTDFLGTSATMTLRDRGEVVFVDFVPVD